MEVTEETVRFPKEFRRRGAVVKVYKWERKIALVRKGCTVTRTGYTVAWYVAGCRHMLRLRTADKAIAEAKSKVAKLAEGMPAVTTVSTEDARLLEQIRRKIAPATLSSAIEEWSHARRIVGGEILSACRAWSDRHGGSSLPDVTVEKAVEKFLAAKKRQGVDVGASYKSRLPIFEEAFRGRLLRDLTPAQLQKHLDGIKHPVTRNTHRTRILTLFRWARKVGILPQERQTAAERTDSAKEAPLVVGIVTPEQLRSAFTIIGEKARHYLPALALTALCGMRRSEVHGQHWADIDLDRAFVRVTTAKRGTPARRLVPLNAAAIAWLTPHRKAKGSICENLAIDRIRDICRTADLNLPENGFRHAYISARVAAEGDIPRAAMDAGTSVKMIHRHYRELMTGKEGKDYLETAPVDGDVVVPMIAHG